MGFVGSSSGRGSSPAAFLVMFSALENRYQIWIKLQQVSCKELQCQPNVTKDIHVKNQEIITFFFEAMLVAELVDGSGSDSKIGTGQRRLIYGVPQQTIKQKLKKG